MLPLEFAVNISLANTIVSACPIVLIFMCLRPIALENIAEMGEDAVRVQDPLQCRLGYHE